MTSPKRAALLFGSQTPNGSFLPGVLPDLRNVINFLKSPNGGVFRDSEIKAIYNPTCNQVLSVVQNTVADYVFIYFSGHGFTDWQGQRMLALSNGNVNDLLLLNGSPRQLIMSDSCRTHERGAMIGSTKWPGERWLYFNGYSEARSVFDQYISNSSAGKVIIHATEDDRMAFERPHGKGGEFTMAMLETVLKYQHQGANGYLDLPTVLNEVQGFLREKNIDQIPTCVYSSGYFQIPFAIVSPSFVFRKERAHSFVHPRKTNPVETLLKALGIGLACYGVYNGLKNR